MRRTLSIECEESSRQLKANMNSGSALIPVLFVMSYVPSLERIGDFIAWYLARESKGTAPVTPVGWIMYDPKYVQSRGKLGRSLPPRKFFDQEKILVVRTRNLSLARRIIATVDYRSMYNLNRLSNIISRDGAPLEGLLGILNSNLFNWLFSTRFYDYEIKPVYLRSCPLADSSDSNLNQLVRQLLDLNKRRRDVRTDHQRVVAQRQIERTEAAIDSVVYELYGLTARDIAIIEAI
jgi:adenine-specific DNA-methyltransferase